jgi:hypothetical protein
VPGLTLVVVLLLILLPFFYFAVSAQLFRFSRTDSRFTDHKASDPLSESDFFAILFLDVVRREKTKAVEARREDTQRSRDGYAKTPRKMDPIR